MFSSRKWEGEISETEEMKPIWFDFDKIPFENMWKDDPYVMHIDHLARKLL